MSSKSRPMPVEVAAMLLERELTMADFSPDHKPVHMYAIYRRDLEMSPNKMAAQCGHAFSKLTHLAEGKEGLLEGYWGTGEGTKIIGSVKNFGQLMKLYEKLVELKLEPVVVIDRGHILPPHFDGQPIVTAVGVGPVLKHDMDSVKNLFTLVDTP